MNRSACRVLFLCNNPGNQLRYTRIFNELSVYRLTLCDDIAEAAFWVKGGQKFDYFVYDDFVYSVKSCNDLLQFRTSIRHIILAISDIESQYSEVIKWARLDDVRLLGLLPRPISAGGLDRLLSNQRCLDPNRRMASGDCH